jgi:phosphate-selective porin OprO/OprP
VKKHLIVGAIAMLAFIAPAYSGSANADEISLMDILEAKGVLSKEEVKEVKKAEKAEHKKLYFGGRIMADYAFYADDTGLDMGDGQEFRRARLFAKGQFGDWHFKGQYDFAGNKATLKDAYIKYKGFNNITISGGQFYEEFSMEAPSSSKYITFMERAMVINALSPFRHIGLGINGYGDYWTGAVGVFGGTAAGSKTGIDSSFDVSGRVTVAPLHEKGRVLHLGGSVSYRVPDSNRELRIRARPESHVTHFRLVDTGTISNVDNFINYGLEGAAVYGPVSVQGEYIRTNVNFVNGAANEPTFDGFYAYASWFVTGESRPYSSKTGRFGRIHPKQNFQLGADGWGAWEIAARFSQLDLEDAGFAGGKEQNITVGLNWYPHPHVRFMFNWVHASVDRSPLVATYPLMATNNFSPDVFQMRAQVDF